MVRNLPSNAGDMGLIPGRGTMIPGRGTMIPGRGTMIPHAMRQLSLHATTTEPARHNNREAGALR